MGYTRFKNESSDTFILPDFVEPKSAKEIEDLEDLAKSAIVLPDAIIELKMYAAKIILFMWYLKATKPLDSDIHNIPDFNTYCSGVIGAGVAWANFPDDILTELIQIYGCEFDILKEGTYNVFREDFITKKLEKSS